MTSAHRVDLSIFTLWSLCAFEQWNSAAYKYDFVLIFQLVFEILNHSWTWNSRFLMQHLFQTISKLLKLLDIVTETDWNTTWWQTKLNWHVDSSCYNHKDWWDHRVHMTERTHRNTTTHEHKLTHLKLLFVTFNWVTLGLGHHFSHGVVAASKLDIALKHMCLPVAGGVNTWN